MANKPRLDFPTDEHLAQIEALGAFLSIEQICEYFGISKGTFYSRVKEDDRINERYKKGRARAIASVAKGLLSDAIDGDNACRFFYLKTQAGWRENAPIVLEEKDNSVTVTIKRAARND